MMTEKLSERVERLEGPDRKIDFAIGEVVIGLRHVGAGLYDTDNPSGPYYSEDGGDYPAYPSYTASLDAAMSLVPEGWLVTHLSELGGAGGCICKLGNPGTAQDVISDSGERTMAIALCAAAIKARGL